VILQRSAGGADGVILQHHSAECLDWENVAVAVGAADEEEEESVL